MHPLLLPVAVFILTVVLIVVIKPALFVSVSPTDKSKKIKWIKTLVFSAVIALAVTVVYAIYHRGMQTYQSVTPVLDEQRVLLAV